MADNLQCLRTIDGWIEDLKKTPEAIKKMPQALVPIVKRECDSAIAAGHGLDGQKWVPRKKDGKQALSTAQHDLSVDASGNIIWIRLRGGPVFSQFGTHRQVQRAILPTHGMPKLLGNAIRTGIVDMGLPFMTRKGRHDRGAKGVKWSPSQGGP